MRVDLESYVICFLSVTGYLMLRIVIIKGKFFCIKNSHHLHVYIIYIYIYVLYSYYYSLGKVLVGRCN